MYLLFFLLIFCCGFFLHCPHVQLHEGPLPDSARKISLPVCEIEMSRLVTHTQFCKRGGEAAEGALHLQEHCAAVCTNKKANYVWVWGGE